MLKTFCHKIFDWNNSYDIGTLLWNTFIKEVLTTSAKKSLNEFIWTTKFTCVRQRSVVEINFVNFFLCLLVADGISQIPFQIRLRVVCDHRQTGFIQPYSEMLHKFWSKMLRLRHLSKTFLYNIMNYTNNRRIFNSFILWILKCLFY